MQRDARRARCLLLRAVFVVVARAGGCLLYTSGNVNRFGAFLQEYARQTQFIVVTHRKGTMQAADVLYGVTVEDTGVSRVLSVKLE